MDLLTYPLAFLVLLGILVTFHEFGHYIVARWSGVQVLRFSVGFGRPIWSFTDSRGTEFALAAIPFGGYVRMLDDRDPDQASLKREGDRAYMDLHPRWRIAIALGGPVANFILAILVFAVLGIAGKYVPTPMTNVPDADSLLGKAGVNTPVQVVSIDGVTTGSWQEIGFALTRRLGESGTVEVGIKDLATDRIERVDVQINTWLEGTREPDVLSELGFVPATMSVIGQVVEDSPAAAAGLEMGDWIVKTG